MKSFAKSTILTISLLSTLSIANAFMIGGQCNISPSSANCFVFNSFYRPIFCRLNAVASTYSGASFNGFTQGVILPGQYMTINVNANNPYYDALNFANVNANCNF